MTLPSHLVVKGVAFALDGGTKLFEVSDDAGIVHWVTLTQRARPRLSPPPYTRPGRLYFDFELIPIRSDLEAALVALLRSATSDDSTEPLIAGVVAYVESEEYLLFAQRVEQAVDATLYDVHVSLGAVPVPRGAVYLRQLFNLDYRAATAVLTGDQPVKSAVTALDVVELATRLAQVGLGARITPAFPWALPAPIPG